jgi:hypothetical protein
VSAYNGRFGLVKFTGIEDKPELTAGAQILVHKDAFNPLSQLLATLRAAQRGH